MIRNIAIIAIAAVVGFVAFTGAHDANSSAKATVVKMSSRQAAIEAAIEGK